MLRKSKKVLFRGRSRSLLRRAGRSTASETAHGKKGGGFTLLFGGWFREGKERSKKEKAAGGKRGMNALGFGEDLLLAKRKRAKKGGMGLGGRENARWNRGREQGSIRDPMVLGKDSVKMQAGGKRAGNDGVRR